MKVLGIKFNAYRAIIGLAVLFLVLQFVNRPLRISPREPFTAFGSPVGEQPTADVLTSWLKKPFEFTRNGYETNHQGRTTVNENQLDILGDNIFSPECCLYDSRYSSSEGCACITSEQNKILGGCR